MTRLRNLEQNDLRSIRIDDEKRECRQRSGGSSQQQSQTANSGVEMSSMMADNERKLKFFYVNDKTCRKKDVCNSFGKNSRGVRNKTFVSADDYTSIRDGNNENDVVYVISESCSMDGVDTLDDCIVIRSMDGVDTLDDCIVIDDVSETVESATPVSRYSPKNFLDSFLTFTSTSPSVQKREAFDLSKTMDDLLELQEERLADGERVPDKTEEPLISMEDLEDSLLLPCTPPATENGLEIPRSEFSGVDVEFLSRWLMSNNSTFNSDRDDGLLKVDDVSKIARQNVDENDPRCHQHKKTCALQSVDGIINSTQSVSLPFGVCVNQTPMNVPVHHRDRIRAFGAGGASSGRNKADRNNCKRNISVYPVVTKTVSTQISADSNYMNEFSKFLEVKQISRKERDRHWFSCPKSSRCRSRSHVTNKAIDLDKDSESNFLLSENSSNCRVNSSSTMAVDKKDCRLNFLTTSKRSLKCRADGSLTVPEGDEKCRLNGVLSSQRSLKHHIQRCQTVPTTSSKDCQLNVLSSADSSKHRIDSSLTVAENKKDCQLNAPPSTLLASAGESKRQTVTSLSCKSGLRQRGATRKRKCFCCSDGHVENSLQKVAPETPTKRRKTERKKTKEIDHVSLTSKELRLFSVAYERLFLLESKLFRLLRVLFPSVLEISGLKEHSHCLERLLDRMICALQDSYNHVHMQNQSLCCPSITLCLSPARCLLTLQRKTLEFLRLILPSLQPEEVDPDDLEQIIERVIAVN